MVELVERMETMETMINVSMGSLKKAAVLAVKAVASSANQQSQKLHVTMAPTMAPVSLASTQLLARFASHQVVSTAPTFYLEVLVVILNTSTTLILSQELPVAATTSVSPAVDGHVVPPVIAAMV